jgi:thiol-disulfide isomerase/thioredoxin
MRNGFRASLTRTAALLVLVAAGPVRAQSLGVGDYAPFLEPSRWFGGPPVPHFPAGRIHVVAFWATWSPPCLEVLPILSELQKRFGSEELRVVAVAGNERGGADRLEGFLAEHQDELALTFAYDDSVELARQWLAAAGQTTIPTAFVVDHHGRIAWIGHPAEGLDAAVEQAVKEAAEARQRLRVGDPAPELRIKTWIQGAPFAAFQPGAVYVVEFWATWCNPCRRSIPCLAAIQDEYADEELRVVAIASSEHHDDQYVREFVSRWAEEIPYSVAYENDAGNYQRWMGAAGLSRIPLAFVVDRAGRIAWVGHPLRGLRSAVQRVMAGQFDLTQHVEYERKAELVEAALERGRWDLASPLIDELVEYDGELFASQAFRKFRHLICDEEYQAAFDFARRTSKTSFHDSAEGLNSVAWEIVEPMKCRIPEPDLALALSFAERADELTGGADASILDTLARVHFRLGHLETAVELQERAVARLESGPALFSAEIHRQITDRLEEYRRQRTEAAALGADR